MPKIPMNLLHAAGRFMLLAILYTFTPSTVYAVSFNCAKAYTATEKTICSQPELGELDSAMARVYRSLRVQTPASGRMALVKEQRRWLRKNVTVAAMLHVLRKPITPGRLCCR